MDTSRINRAREKLNEAIEFAQEQRQKGAPYDFNFSKSIFRFYRKYSPGLAIELLETMGGAGDEDALLYLAQIYYTGSMSDLGIPYLQEDSMPNDRVIFPDPAQSRGYLIKAADLGSTSAMLTLMGESYIEDGAVKYRDPENALFWLRRAADAGCETASEGWADHLANGRIAQECSAEEVEEIEKYYNQSSRWANKNYKLARFHSDGLSTTNYWDDEYARARYWLYKGAGDSRPDSERESCEKVIREWGVEEVEPKRATSTTMVIAQAIGLVAVLVLWAMIGTFIAAFAFAVMSVTVPVLIGIYALFKIYSYFSSSR